MVKFRPKVLPRGYGSVLVVCAYISEFGQSISPTVIRESPRQRAAVCQLSQQIEAAAENRSIDNKTLIYITGDFNGARTDSLRNNYQLHLVNKAPTRKQKLLDVVLTNAPNCYSPDTLPALKTSDHAIVKCTPPAAEYKATIPPTKRVQIRTGKVADTVAAIRCMNWDGIIKTAIKSPKQAMDMFYSVLLTAQDTHQPLKLVKARNDKPWMTQEILQLIKQRDKLAQSNKHDEWKLAAKITGDAINKRSREYIAKAYKHRNPNYWQAVNSSLKRCTSSVEYTDPKISTRVTLCPIICCRLTLECWGHFKPCSENRGPSQGSISML